jgi:ubiquinone/menaquinone biosynthesis C-methylase UbiE
VRGVEQIPWLYDAGMVLLEKTGLGRWREWLAAGTPPGRVLDLGCGTGRNLPLFARGVRAVGLDPCHASLLEARRRAPGALLVRARAESLPFRDGVFDTVVSGLVFCSVADVPRGLAEVGRVLRAGGVLRMLEHVRATGRLAARLQDLTQPAWTWFTGGCHPNRDTEAAVLAAGFAIDRETYRAQGDMRRFVTRACRGPERHARDLESPLESLPGKAPSKAVS